MLEGLLTKQLLIFVRNNISYYLNSKVTRLRAGRLKNRNLSVTQARVLCLSHNFQIGCVALQAF